MNGANFPAPSISVCIPTHGRADLLREALESCRQQTRPPSELLVSDDLGAPEVRELIETFAASCPFPVRYTRCLGRGLAENVNHCFREAASDLLLLLHDDDLIFPECLALLHAPFTEHPEVVAAYGKQMIIRQDGEELFEKSVELNARYHRETRDAGLQESAFRSAVLRQFPNDGYLVSTKIARQVLHDPAYGAASEVDFGIRCAERGRFFFVDEFTAKYRLSLDSIGRGAGRKNDDCGYFTTVILSQLLPEHPENASIIQAEIRREIPVAVAQAISLGHLRQAARWLLGPHHRPTFRKPAGWYRALRLLIAAIAAPFGTKKSS